MSNKVTVMPDKKAFKSFADFKDLASFGKYYKEVEADLNSSRTKAFTVFHELEVSAYMASWHLGGIIVQFMNPGGRKVGASAEEIAKATGISKTTVYEQKSLYQNMTLEEVRTFAEKQIYKKLLYATAHLSEDEKKKVMQLVLSTKVDKGDTDACIELNAQLKALLAPAQPGLPEGIPAGQPNTEENPKSPAASTSDGSSSKKDDNIPTNMSKARTELRAMQAKLEKLKCLDVLDAVDDCHIPAAQEGDKMLAKYMEKTIEQASDTLKELKTVYADMGKLINVISAFLLSSEGEVDEDEELPDDPDVGHVAKKGK
ncbi:MAG: hypothetical protein WC262_09090 [Bacteroidales bacterium]